MPGCAGIRIISYPNSGKQDYAQKDASLARISFPGPISIGLPVSLKPRRWMIIFERAAKSAMPILTSTHREDGLTVFTASGPVTFEEQMAALVRFYNASPTPNVIWDFRNIEGNRISGEELRALIRYAKSNSGKRLPGKTALVTGTLLDFGLSRMGTTFSELEGSPWKMASFKDFQEARDWINEKECHEADSQNQKSNKGQTNDRGGGCPP